MTAANPNRNGTGTVYTAFTAGTAGSIINWMRFTPQGNTAAGSVRAFEYDLSNYHLLCDYATGSYNLSGAGTMAAVTIDFIPPPGQMYISANNSIVGCQNNGDGPWQLEVFGLDY